MNTKIRPAFTSSAILKELLQLTGPEARSKPTPARGEQLGESNVRQLILRLNSHLFQK